MNPEYKLHHPKWYRRRMPIFWWLRRFSYTKFISRELTSLAVLYAVLLLLAQVWTLMQGEQAYARFLDLLRSPIAVGIHTVVFLALLFHTVTWLNLAPRAMVVRLGQRRLPDGLVLAAHYLAWLACSGLIAWGILAG